MKFLKSFRRYENVLRRYKLFLLIFQIFSHFLVAKKLMKSAYNRWFQHFFYFQQTVSRLFNNFIRCYIGITLVLLEIWRKGARGWVKLTPPPHQRKNYLQKAQLTALSSLSNILMIGLFYSNSRIPIFSKKKKNSYHSKHVTDHTCMTST